MNDKQIQEMFERIWGEREDKIYHSWIYGDPCGCHPEGYKTKGERMAEIKLGDKVRDAITGYTGIVISITVWLNGCRRFALHGPPKKKGDVPDDEYWIDEGQAILVKAGAFKLSKGKKKKAKRPSGPTSSPTRQRDPRR